jgi:preprotein translocase subunit SecE
LRISRGNLFLAAIWAAAVPAQELGRNRKGTAIGAIGIGVMAKISPFKFLQEVRQEVAKVTWPSRRETTITTIMVFVFAAAAGLFFLMADQVIRMIVTAVLGIGH